MWITRSRYESLVQAEARTLAAESQVTRLLRDVDAARDQAERALEAMLAVRQLPSLQPQQPTAPEPAMFDDDPAVLAAWAKAGRNFNSPFEELLPAAGDGPRE